MLALFRKCFRWLRPDGVRAPDKPVPENPVVLEVRSQEFRPLEIEGRWLVVRIPIPPEETLMDMLYHNREHQRPLGLLFDIGFDGDFCEQLISAQRAETPIQRETTG